MENSSKALVPTGAQKRLMGGVDDAHHRNSSQKLTSHTDVTSSGFKTGRDTSSRELAKSDSKSPKKPLTIFGKEEEYGLKIAYQSLATMKPGDRVLLHAFSLRNEELTKTLSTKAKEGVSVEVIVDGKDPKNIELGMQVVKAGGKVWKYVDKQNEAKQDKYRKQLHKKALSWVKNKVGTNPESGQPENQIVYRTIDGSANFTHKVAANQELSIYDTTKAAFENLQADHEELKKMTTPLHQNPDPISPIKTNSAPSSVIAESPQKSSSYLSSLRHNLAATLLERLKKEDHKSRMLMYSLDETAEESILAACKNGRLTHICVNYIVYEKNKDFLKKCADYGTKVAVFNHDRSKKFFNMPVDLHAKGLVRSDDLVVVSSGNLTVKNNNDINSMSMHKDEQLAQEFRTQFEKIWSQSTALEKIITPALNVQVQSPYGDQSPIGDTSIFSRTSTNVANSSSVAPSKARRLSFSAPAWQPTIFVPELSLIKSQLTAYNEDLEKKSSINTDRYQRVLNGHAKNIAERYKIETPNKELDQLFSVAVEKFAQLTKQDASQLMNNYVALREPQKQETEIAQVKPTPLSVVTSQTKPKNEPKNPNPFEEEI
jgi:phosphatidylserine/phosphatidylglycerophosphate/cardiolipin synthase-like enzyme